MFRSILISTFSFLILSCGITFSQTRIKKPVIQEITIEDSILVKHVKNFIHYEEKQGKGFTKNKGFVILNIDYKVKNGGNYIDTVFTCSLVCSTMSLKYKENGLGDLYPFFYTIIEGHPILISPTGMLSNFLDIDEKSKAIFEKMMKPYIETDGNSSFFQWFDLHHFAEIYYIEDKLKSTVKDIIVYKNV